MLHQPLTATLDWTQDRRARALLASCAATPPRVVMIPAGQRWTAEDRTYTGYRAECLQVIWNQHGKRVLAECEVSGDYEPWTEFCCGLTVDDAIDAARVLS